MVKTKESLMAFAARLERKYEIPFTIPAKYIWVWASCHRIPTPPGNHGATSTASEYE